MAGILEVTTRTLRSWEKNCNSPPAKRGRKKAGVTFREQLTIAREWAKQGYPGSRPVIGALPSLRKKLIRAVIAELKKRRAKRYARIRTECRTSVKVHQAGTVLTMDGATVQEGDLVVYRDRGSMSVKSEKCDGSVTSNDTLKVLNKLKEAGQLPLVAMSDNGSPFCAGPVKTFYKENQVIHLRSLPRVPQHNGSCENGVGDMKKSIAHGLKPEEACRRLNQHRRREGLNWQTPCQFEQTNSRVCTSEERSKFYEATCAAINSAVLGIDSAKEKRKAEREAIFRTMERFELITRIRGRRRA